jgi:hypothetical protein
MMDISPMLQALSWARRREVIIGLTSDEMARGQKPTCSGL